MSLSLEASIGRPIDPNMLGCIEQAYLASATPGAAFLPKSGAGIVYANHQELAEVGDIDLNSGQSAIQEQIDEAGQRLKDLGLVDAETLLAPLSATNNGLESTPRKREDERVFRLSILVGEPMATYLFAERNVVRWGLGLEPATSKYLRVKIGNLKVRNKVEISRHAVIKPMKQALPSKIPLLGASPLYIENRGTSVN